MAVVELSRSLRHWRHRVRARSGRSLEALVHHRGGPATLQPDPARHPPDVCARLAGVTARAGYRDRPAQGLPPAPRGLARLLGLGAAGLSVAAGALRARASACESGGEERGRAGEQGDADEDDDFDFEFAKPPVAQVDLGLQVSVQLSRGSAAGHRRCGPGSSRARASPCRWSAAGRGTR
ncbi:unnamed protein product [Prorocentrum cordatum]|uniref:Uncharacterized protein n=1 Tax=Prorocentrum cordatum TaxID=2364126 RepID=A0ABN9X6C5_9DINO|nr:unnamed protein product [Polarella glacialis]